MTIINALSTSGLRTPLRCDENGRLIAAMDNVIPKSDYITVAASQTDFVLGSDGQPGDLLIGLLVIPAVAACGAVSIKDGTTSISIFAGGGTTALPSLIPFFVPINVPSVFGNWKVTTGASVSVVAIGNFATTLDMSQVDYGLGAGNFLAMGWL